MTPNFSRAIPIILQLEGGDKLVNDSGGLTKYGISSRSYPKLDIANLTEDEATLIYARDYWTPIQGDSLPWPMCVYVFDCAVNQGIAAARKLQAPMGYNGKPPTPDEYLDRRKARYQATLNFDKYGKGWFNRIDRLRKLALADS